MESSQHKQFGNIAEKFPIRQEVFPSISFPKQIKQSLESTIANLLNFLTLERIPDLDGKDIAKTKAFFRKFEAATSEWEDENRIGALKSKVSSRAERALDFALKSGSSSYEEARQSMLNYLEEMEPRRSEAFDELHWGVKRKLNEPVDELAERICVLVELAFRGLPSDLHEDFSIKFLIRALDNPQVALNLELKRGTGMSLDECVLLASRAEAVQKSFDRRQQQEEREKCERLRVGQTRVSPCFSSKFARNEREKKASRMCYKCRKYGHYAGECPQNIRVFQLRTIEKLEGVDVDGDSDGNLKESCQEEDLYGQTNCKFSGAQKVSRIWTWHWRKKRRLTRKVPPDGFDEDMQKWVNVRMENWRKLERGIDAVGREVRREMANGRSAFEEEQARQDGCVEGSLASLCDCQEHQSAIDVLCS